MARPLRYQYAGAIYHIMARGDGGKDVFEGKHDCEVFLERLGEVCGSCGWRVHAWVLMGNHFHLLLETPQPNLVNGMKWLLGVYSQGWNRARGRQGHVFQGRYKSIPVSGSEADGTYFRIVADYIHLNPARAGLTGGKLGRLVSYRWSSLRFYANGRGPEWFVTDRVLEAFRLSRDGRGRRSYVAWLEARAATGGKIDEIAQSAMRRGWYLGEESFKDKLLGLKDTFSGKKMQREQAVRVDGIREHGERHSEQLIKRHARKLGLSIQLRDLLALPKGDPRKAVLASVLVRQTTVSRQWLAERLAMGHPGSVSRQLGRVKRDKKLQKQVDELCKL